MLYTLVVFTGHQPIENQWRSASNNHVVQTVNRRNTKSIHQKRKKCKKQTRNETLNCHVFTNNHSSLRRPETVVVSTIDGQYPTIHTLSLASSFVAPLVAPIREPMWEVAGVVLLSYTRRLDRNVAKITNLVTTILRSALLSK